MYPHRLERVRRARLAKCIAMTLGPVVLLCGVSPAVFAQCTPSGTTITCATGSNTNSYASSIDNVTMNVESGAVLSVPPIVGGAALTLNGTGITLNNYGRIDPTINGGLSLAASGAILGNGSASNITINNESGGVLNGLVNIASLFGFGGQALVVNNAGSSVLYNSGNIGMSIFGVGTFTTADAPAIVSYGGGQMNISNSGTITGRVGFLGSTIAGFGNNFVNAGTVNGSIYLGNSVSGNTFMAVSGSSVNNAGVGTAGTMTVGTSTINFAAAGKVDAGTGTGNLLVLQNSATGTGSGTGGPVTTLSASDYLDFQNLTVNSGTWNLQGNLVSGSATINDGLVNFNSAGVFGSGSLTVNGGGIESATAGLSLANAVTLNNNLSLEGSNAFTLGGVISGSGGLAITDTSPIMLSAANAFTGGVSISAGGLMLGNASALGTGELTTSGSVTLDTTGSFSLNNSVVVNNGTLNLLGSNPLTLVGPLSGPGSMSWNGAGTLTLAGSDSLSGSLQINNGTLAVGTGGSLSSTGAVSLAPGTTLDLSLGGNQSIGSLAGVGGTVNLGSTTLTLNGLGATTFSGSIAGSGGLIKLGSGTQTLDGASSFTGGVVLSSGGLLLGNMSSLGTGALTVNGTATLDGITMLTLPNAVNLSNGANLVLLGAQAVTLDGAISGTGSLTKNGSAPLTLYGANSFSGGVLLNAGGLLLGNALAMGTGNLTVGGNATLDGAGPLTLSNEIDLNAGATLTLPGTVDIMLDGPVEGAGSLVKNGSSTLTLNTFNPFYGGMTLNGGTVLLASGSAAGSGVLTVGGSVSLDGVTSALNLPNNVSLSAGGSLILPGAQAVTLNGVVSGAGGIVKNGASTLTLNGTDTFTGGLSISAGTVALGAFGSLNTTGAVSLVNPGAMLDISGAAGNQTIGSLSGAAGTNILLGANTLTFGGISNLSFGGTISGTGGLIKQGSGTETLTSANTFTGGLTVNAGTLALGLGGALAGGESVNLASAGSGFDVSAAGNQSIGSLSGVAGTTVSLGGTTLTLGGNGNTTFGGSISGTGGLVKNGTGTQALNGASAFSGGIALNAGGLLVGNNSALGTGALNVNGSATLGASGPVYLTNNVTLGGGGLTVQGGNALTLGGVVSGVGSLALNDFSTLTLTGANTYSGGTNILSGTLALGTGSSLLATGAVTLSGAGVFDISQAGNQTIGSLAGTSGTVFLGSSTLTVGGIGSTTYAGAITGTGALVKNGTSTLTLGGINSYSGGTTINAGTLQGSSTSLQGNILNSAALVFNQGSNGTYGGVMSGTGTVEVNGPGTLTLNGINTGNGLTTVTSGATLLVGDSSHATASVGGDVSVNGGTLGGYGTVQGSVILANNAALAAGAPQAVGTLTVNGDLTIGNGSQLNFDFGAAGPNFSTPGQSDHVVVNGNLAIDTSTLNVNNVGSMGPGLYNLFQWGSSLSITGGGFAPPSGTTLQILTVSKQINLIDTQGLTLNEWDANGLAGPGQMGGGSGTWSLYSSTWSDTTGQYVGPMSPQPAFAIFGGAAGTVTVDDTSGAVGAAGMQFVSDGYHLTGGAINLAGQNGVAPVLRVSSGDTAIIDNVLTGVDGLNKTDGGTLVLAGSNLYTGTTTLSGGYLSVSSDVNLGASANALDFEGGTLEITGTTFTQTARNITWGNPGGGFDIADAANTFTVSQALSGSGGLLKSGAGLLVLTGANTYSGNTVIDAGTLSLSGGGSIANSADVNVAAGAGFDISNMSGNASIVSLDGNGAVNLGGKTLTLTNARGNFAGVITGAGGLTLSGGTETLAGSNLYTGVTTINGGTLALSGSGALVNSPDVHVASGGTFDISAATSGASIISLDGSGAVNLGRQTLTLTNAAGTFSGAIGGSGGLVLTGGAETLSGNSSYQGGTIVTGATLTVSGDANLGAASGGITLQGGTLENTAAFTTNRAITLVGSGTLQTDANLTVSNAIAGNGALAKSGSGTLTLGGTNTYGGGTTISGGTLSVASDANLGAASGGITLQGGTLENTAAFSTARAINIAGSGTLQADANLTASGVLSSSGTLTKTGAGTLILDGNSSGFSGTTTVQAGTLGVGDASSPAAVLGGNVAVASGATLRGHGTIGGNVINNGFLWAGGSIGTLTILGNYTQAANGTLEVEATPSGQVSQVSVGGAANLAGAALVLADTGTWTPRTDFTVITAAGGINGQFAAVSSNFAFLTPTLGYGVNTVTLSLQRNDVNLDAVAQTANQRAVAAAANPLGFGNPVYNALVVLDTATARSAFEQLGGDIHASTRTAIQDDDRYVRDAINQHLAGMTNDANGLNITNDSGVTAWTAVWGHWGSHDSDGDAASFTANGSGVLVGADMPVGDDARLGAVVGSGQGTVRTATPGSSSHVLDQHAGFYGAAQTGPVQWQGGAIYGLQRVDTSRNMAFGAFAGTADSDYHAHSVQGYVDASWPVVVGSTTLAPFANLAYETLHTPSITESGTPAALSVASQDSGVGYGTLGVRASFDLGAPSHGLHAHVGLGWQHAWGDTLPTATMRFVSGGGSFDIAGLPVARNAGAVNGGITFTVTPTVSVDASYQGQFGQRASDQAARISVDWRF